MSKAFESMDPEPDFLEYCLPIIGVANDARGVCGSGVKISSKLMITAFHNITSLADLLGENSDLIDDQSGLISLKNLSIFTIQPVTGELDKNIIWTAEYIYRSEFVRDLALLFLEPVSRFDENWHHSHMGINFDIPKIGDEVAAFGFPEAEIIEAEKNWVFKSAAVLAPGKVTALNEAKPVGYRTFPTIEVETIWPGGISGGPIFFRGGVTGFVTTGFAYLRSDEEMKPHLTNITRVIIEISPRIFDQTSHR